MFLNDRKYIYIYIYIERERDEYKRCDHKSKVNSHSKANCMQNWQKYFLFTFSS